MKSLPFKIIVCAVICLTLGTLSGFSTIHEITNWYQFLIKPSFNPPNWIFGRIAGMLFVDKKVKGIFAYRNRTLETYFKK